MDKLKVSLESYLNLKKGIACREVLLLLFFGLVFKECM